MGSDGKSKEKNKSRKRSSSSDSGDEMRRKRQRSDREHKGKEKKSHKLRSDREKKSGDKHKDKLHKSNHHFNGEFQELTNDDNDSVYTNESNLNAAKFHIRGIEPKLEQKLNRIFVNTVATGEYAYTPSSGRFPFEYEKPFNDNETLFEQLESIDESETPRLDKLPEKKNNKRLTEQFEKQNKKRKKGTGQMQVVGAAKLSHQLGPLVDAVESRSSRTSSVKNETPNFSIPKVMEVLDSLPGLEIGSKLYFFATRLFMVKENREMFIAMETDELKLNWLKYEHDA